MLPRLTLVVLTFSLFASAQSDYDAYRPTSLSEAEKAKLHRTVFDIIKDAGWEEAPSGRPEDPRVPRVTGGPAEPIIKIVKANSRAEKKCAEAEFADGGVTSGAVVIRFIISPLGTVTAAKVHETTLKRPTLEACLVAAVMNLNFPKPKGGIEVVTYPFVFGGAK